MSSVRTSFLNRFWISGCLANKYKAQVTLEAVVSCLKSAISLKTQTPTNIHDKEREGGLPCSEKSHNLINHLVLRQDIIRHP